MSDLKSKHSIFARNALGIFLTFWPVVFVSFFQYSCFNHSCSLYHSLFDLSSFIKFFLNFINPFSVSMKTFVYLLGWYLFQMMLYLLVPGRSTEGRALPSGRILAYKCNGSTCFCITILVCIYCCSTDLIDITYFSKNIAQLLTLSNFFGFFLAVFAYLKALYFPDCEADCYYSGSNFYDFYCGVEHSPRIYSFDFKQFFNARPGIILWPIINISYMVHIKQVFGYTPNSILLINFLQVLYVIDLFSHEEWYMRTIDIAHDHFGFYLAWGDLVWLPFMYTLQGFYLTVHPVKIPSYLFIAIFLFGIASIIFFRLSNNQKEDFRNAMSEGRIYTIFGRAAKYIKAAWVSADKQSHQSYLLADGFWGISRHFNYLTDLCNALCYCIPCGFSHIFPYFYFIYMLILLLHRIRRDQIRCKEKYGSKWDKYCYLVPYKLIPYVY